MRACVHQEVALTLHWTFCDILEESLALSGP